MDSEGRKVIVCDNGTGVSRSFFVNFLSKMRHTKAILLLGALNTNKQSI